MPMPKGMRHEKGYATVTGEGLGYREIAEEMTRRGHKMNHASARNYFIRAMKKLAKSVQDVNPGANTDTIATDPLFQSAVSSFLREKKNGVSF